MKRIFLAWLALGLLASSAPSGAGEVVPDLPAITILETVLTHHPGVQREQEALQGAAATLASRKMQRLPGLSFEALTGEDDQDKAVASLVQPIWVGGRIRNAITGARTRLRLAEISLAGIQRDLVERTLLVLADLEGLENQIRAGEKNRDEHQRLLELISRRRRGKIASRVDVRLGQSRLSQARLTLRDLKGKHQRARNDLLALTRVPVSPVFPLPDFLGQVPGLDPALDQVTRNAPDLAMARGEIESATAEAALKKSQLLPRLYGKLEQEIYNGRGYADTGRDTTLALVGEASLDGAGLSQWQEVKAARAGIRAARMSARASEIEISRQTRSLVTDIALYQGMVALNRDLVASTAGTLASYARQYEAGRKRWLDLLNIQQEHARARLALEQAATTLARTKLKLAVRLGRLDPPCRIRL